MQTSGRWRIDSSHSSTFHVEFHLFRVYVRVVAVPFDNEISARVYKYECYENRGERDSCLPTVLSLLYYLH